MTRPNYDVVSQPTEGNKGRVMSPDLVVDFNPSPRAVALQGTFTASLHLFSTDVISMSHALGGDTNVEVAQFEDSEVMRFTWSDFCIKATGDFTFFVKVWKECPGWQKKIDDFRIGNITIT